MSTRSTLDQMVAGILQAAGMSENIIEITINGLSRQREKEIDPPMFTTTCPYCSRHRYTGGAKKEVECIQCGGKWAHTTANTIDGHPIEYWHRIAREALKTNDELITNVRERTREREELEEKLENQAKRGDFHKYREEHQRECAKKAQDERDAAVRELDALREVHRELQNEHVELRRRMKGVIVRVNGAATFFPEDCK